MHRYVLLFDVGDGYTFSFTISCPLEYEGSKDELEVELLVRAEEAYAAKNEDFVFNDIRFPTSNFYVVTEVELRRKTLEQVSYVGPQILTLDEWYKYYKDSFVG